VLPDALYLGIRIAPAAGLMFGLRGMPGDLAAAASPQAALARDRRSALILVLVAVIVTALVAATVATRLVVANWPFAGGIAAEGGAPLVAGVLFGLAAGFGFNAAQTAWPSYVLARGLLALCQQLPWPLMSFLADAHRRGVLRQAGAAYQFRHIELQHRLATRDVNEQQASSSSRPSADCHW
jgi:hypothetical protein